jgi:hypothetical protein
LTQLNLLPRRGVNKRDKHGKRVLIPEQRLDLLSTGNRQTHRIFSVRPQCRNDADASTYRLIERFIIPAVQFEFSIIWVGRVPAGPRICR